MGTLGARARSFFYQVCGLLGWSFTPLWNFLASVGIAVILFFSTKDRGLDSLYEQLFWSLLLFTVLYFFLSIRRVRWLHGEWSYYGHILGKVIYGPEEEYSYKDIRFIYLIGKSPRTDEWLRKYKLVTSDKVLKVKSFMFGVAGVGTREIPFQALGVRASTVDEAHKHTRIHVVPYADNVAGGRTDHWYGALVFDPELEPNTTVDFTLRGFWHGTWNPLR